MSLGMGQARCSGFGRSGGRTREFAVGSGDIKDVGVVWVGRDIAAFAAAYGEPVAQIDLVVQSARCGGGGSAILLRAIDVIGGFIIGDHVIELPGGLVVPGAPGFAAVEGDGGALIGSEHHVQGIGGIDPDLVIIVAAGRAADDAEIPAAVAQFIKRHVRNVDDIGVVGIDSDAVEIPGAFGDAGIVVDECPSSAAIVTAIQARLFGFDDGVDAAAAGAASDCDTDASPGKIGQAVAGELGPGIAAILRTEEPTSVALNRSIDAPGHAMRFPQGSEQDMGFIGSHGKICGSDIWTAIENFLPGCAAIVGAEYAALFIRAIGMPQGGDEDLIGIARIYDNAADLARVVQANMLPRVSAVGGFVDAVARGEIRADV